MKISHVRVALVRKRGYATDRGEHTVDSSCLAVPIYDYTRKVMAAMSVSGHGLLDRCEEVYVYEKMRDAALDLSHTWATPKSSSPPGVHICKTDHIPRASRIIVDFFGLRIV